jgi:hypothetical protein
MSTLPTKLAYAAFLNDGPVLAQYARENEHTGRSYVDPETGMKYPSVTTVLKNTPKGDLMRWAARVVAERARDRVDIVLGDPDKVVDRLQYAPSDYRDERAWVGSGIHKAVDAHMKNLWHDDSEFTNEQHTIMSHFDSFLDDYSVEPILSECTILGDGYMGTLDGVWKFKNKWTGKTFTSLVDVKTSKSVWPDHEYQLAALSKATHWFEMVGEGTPESFLHKHPSLGDTWWLKHDGMPHFDNVHILHVTKDGYDFIPVLDIEENYSVFRSYLELWGNLNVLKQKRKERDFG